jgi:hypothetical protein
MVATPDENDEEEMGRTFGAWKRSGGYERMPEKERLMSYIRVTISHH